MKLNVRNYCIVILFFLLLSAEKGFGLDDQIARFLAKYPFIQYQDLLVQNRVIRWGTDLCAPRYDLMEQIFEMYRDREFRVLDLGAAQGYFSFRIAESYPNSSCLMIEGNSTRYASSKPNDMLTDICNLNAHLNNVTYIQKLATLSDLDQLNQDEHFDIVLALLVTHQMYPTLADQIKVIQRLLTLGDNVVIEVAEEVAVPLTEYVEALSKKTNCTCLGQVKRHRDSDSKYTGTLFWFRGSNR